MANTDRAKLRKDNPDVWVPVNPGDHIDGQLVEVTAAWSDVQYDGRDPQSGYYPLLRIQVHEAPGYDAGKLLAVHAFGAVLRDRILTHEPVPGERVVITYEGEGEAKTRGRNAPQLYRLDLPERAPEQVAAKAYSHFSRGRAPGVPMDIPVSGDYSQPAHTQGDLPFAE